MAFVLLMICVGSCAAAVTLIGSPVEIAGWREVKEYLARSFNPSSAECSQVQCVVTDVYLVPSVVVVDGNDSAADIP